MPLVKVHLSQTTKAAELLAGAIRETIVEVLGIAADIGQVMIYQTPVELRSVHNSREQNFAVVEIVMYSGRNRVIKEKLSEKICSLIKSHINIGLSDIHCYIIEIAPENYYGGDLT
ncbi:MAG: tautomerase family protein [Firmicutes bacterium]|jgi:phenylpyruvate tautomerase PptA (4-oxalocrotonate tautomerase family)|nr:tautomerase family protein [Bacillota bacterium]